MGPNITFDNVSGLIHLKSNANLGIEPEIEFLAQNFVGCSMEFLTSVDFDIMCQILSHPSLTVLNEDHLCEFVLSRIGRDESQIPLLEFVMIEFLSSETLAKVLSYLEQVSPTLNRAIWDQITLRLKRTGPQRPATKSRYARPARVMAKLDCQLPFVGIIDMLTRSCGGNVHDKGIVTITPSGGRYAAMSCDAIVDYSRDSNFSSLASANEWICFDFKEKTVKPNGYSIRAHTIRGTRLKSWVIEGSNDCVDWFELDRKAPNSRLNEKGVVATFTIDHPKSCRFVRLRQIEPNWDGSWALGLAAMEFFGVLKVHSKCTFTVTGSRFKYQQWYQCLTCGLVGQLGCCELCAQSCHRGHQLISKGCHEAYCDCKGQDRCQL
jgi:hypothetical protein